MPRDLLATPIKECSPGTNVDERLLQVAGSNCEAAAQAPVTQFNTNNMWPQQSHLDMARNLQPSCWEILIVP